MTDNNRYMWQEGDVEILGGAPEPEDEEPTDDE